MRGRDEPKPTVPSAWAPADPRFADGVGAAAATTDWAPAHEHPAGTSPQDDSPTQWLPTGIASRPDAAPGDNRAPALDPELQARRRQAVIAFFTEVSGRATAQRFGAEALDVFVSRSAAGEIDGSDESLLGVTGELAAQRKLLSPQRTGWRGAVRGALAEESACSATASLLAARAAGRLDESGRRDLEAHLADCLTCRAAEVRWQRAERTFRTSLQFGRAAAPSRERVAGLRAGVAAGAVGVAAAGATASGATAAAWTSPPAPAAAASSFAQAAPSVPAAQAGRRPLRGGRLSGVPLVAALALAVAVVAAAAVIVLGGGSTPKQPVQAASPSVKSVQPAGGASVAPSRHARPHAKPVVHHRARRHHRPKPAPPATTAAPVTASVPSSGAVTPTAVAPAPTPTPVASSPPPPPSSGGGSGSSSPSATIQQPSLGASNAPTQTISPKH